MTILIVPERSAKKSLPSGAQASAVAKSAPSTSVLWPDGPLTVTGAVAHGSAGADDAGADEAGADDGGAVDGGDGEEVVSGLDDAGPLGSSEVPPQEASTNGISRRAPTKGRAGGRT